ncbi:MAG TPA: DegT/DnrJ/EryC1/StrS family aminotransferase [Gammaproteobacteria bacterium]|nr:DegT/DnrJ/EryC1/StrS family aminotransferase [Gammaproteobacteria bacterium]
MKVLFNDLKRETAELRAQLDAAAARVMERGWYLVGEELKSFEQAFARYLGVNHSLGMANGTDALELALRCLDVGAGDKVIVAPNAGMYGTIAVSRVGAEPVFADVDPHNLCLSPAGVEAAARCGAKAVIITHLYGQMADAKGIVTVARKHGLRVIEDCAQAHGARRDGTLAGTLGDIACFSFYPTKNLGALGDAGGVATNDATLADKAATLRQYGWKGKYRVEVPHGRNSRMDELQAAFLLAKLPHLDARNERRRAIWRRYREALGGKLQLVGNDGADFVAHLCVLRSPDRDGLRQRLSDAGIATDIHYPIPDHRQPVWGGRFDAVSLPAAEKACAEVLSLPCFPEMTEQEVAHVTDALRKV